MAQVKFKYVKAQKGRHIAKHLIASAEAMVRALPPRDEAAEGVAAFTELLNRASNRLAGRAGLTREQQVERATEARSLVEDAIKALKQIDYSGSPQPVLNLLVDANTVLVDAKGHLTALIQYLKDRRFPYSGEQRAYFPGENDAPQADVSDDEEEYDEDDEF